MKGLVGEIKVKLSSVDGWNIVEIQDNGAGFGGNFESDESSESMKTTPHPGLGLSVASEIVRDHGGRLEIRSAKGLGATAIISLPRPVLDP